MEAVRQHGLVTVYCAPEQVRGVGCGHYTAVQAVARKSLLKRPRLD